jgi:hypothetical protein
MIKFWQGDEMKMRWERHVTCMGMMKYAYKIMVGKREGKKPLGRPRYRQEDDIRMDLREIGWKRSDQIHLVGDRYQLRAVVNMIMNLQVT